MRWSAAMVLTTLALVSVGRATTDPLSAESKAPSASRPAGNAIGLERYLGKDLRPLKASTGVSRAFSRDYKHLIGRPPRQWPLAPYWVKRYSSASTEWMCLEATTLLVDVPSSAGALVRTFDAAWQPREAVLFHAGYRLSIREAQLGYKADAGQQVLCLTLESQGPFLQVDGGPRRPAFHQGAFQRQYYGLAQGKLALLRYEDDTGAPIPNNYASLNQIGPDVAGRGAARWMELLRSDQVGDQLSALVWLTGAHPTVTEALDPDATGELPRQVLHYESVRDAPETRAILQALTGSQSRWVKEYAGEALRMLDAPPGDPDDREAEAPHRPLSSDEEVKVAEVVRLLKRPGWAQTRFWDLEKRRRVLEDMGQLSRYDLRVLRRGVKKVASDWRLQTGTPYPPLNIFLLNRYLFDVPEKAEALPKGLKERVGGLRAYVWPLAPDAEGKMGLAGDGASFNGGRWELLEWVDLEFDLFEKLYGVRPKPGWISRTLGPGTK